MVLFDLQHARKKLRKRVSGWRPGADFSSRIRSIGHLLAGNASSTVIGLVAFALTARALGPTQYGILALCFTYTRAIERIISFQSWQPLIKYGAEALEGGRTEDLKQLLKFGLVLDLSAAILAWALAVVLLVAGASLFGIAPDTRTLALIYCFVLPFQLSGMPTAVLRLFGRFRSLAYLQVASSVARACLCGVGVALNWGLLEFTLIWMLTQIFSGLGLLWIAMRVLRGQNFGGILFMSMQGIRVRFPGLWRFSLSANLSLTIRSSASELDTLIVGALTDAASAGLYHIAKRIGRLGQQAGVQVQAVVYPELSRAWAAQSIKSFTRIVSQTQLLLLAAGIIGLVVLYPTIEPLLVLAAGPAFAAAAPLVIVQGFAVVLTLCAAVLRSALLSMGQERAVLNSVLIATLFFHATALVAIPQIGAMGANIAHIVMSALWLITMHLSYRRLVGSIKE
ncbi:lipopolysaccharide biosynthesis protein [Rhizobium sp. TRM95111]|uniref:lipopolysaccharide biosynthesis protein n=1 Tax=Rhizobium alarense TaxID=2846851 RepID=UPI001F34261A|nr:lipopolysaccharide biosynthesis protein [Rhizobium alarense]MCF3641819.1 lipopolysaccharide biosynthesis protein [Rhizobium alarense]